MRCILLWTIVKSPLLFPASLSCDDRLFRYIPIVPDDTNGTSECHTLKQETAGYWIVCAAARFAKIRRVRARCDGDILLVAIKTGGPGDASALYYFHDESMTDYPPAFSASADDAHRFFFFFERYTSVLSIFFSAPLAETCARVYSRRVRVRVLRAIHSIPCDFLDFAIIREACHARSPWAIQLKRSVFCLRL